MSDITTTNSDTDKMITFLLDQGYTHVRAVEGGYVGLIKLIYTTGLCIGLSEYGYEERYCYENKELAIRAVNYMKSVDDEPIAGYVAKRVK